MESVFVNVSIRIATEVAKKSAISFRFIPIYLQIFARFFYWIEINRKLLENSRLIFKKIPKFNQNLKLSSNQKTDLIYVAKFSCNLSFISNEYSFSFDQSISNFI